MEEFRSVYTSTRDRSRSKSATVFTLATLLETGPAAEECHSVYTSDVTRDTVEECRSVYTSDVTRDRSRSGRVPQCLLATLAGPAVEEFRSVYTSDVTRDRSRSGRVH